VSSSLFSTTVDEVLLEYGRLRLYSRFLEDKEASDFFNRLQQQVSWRQDALVFAGKKVAIPRLQAWFGDEGARYTYSGLTLNPELWTPDLHVLKTKIEFLTGLTFNSLLANYYRDGCDSIAWHSDDEPELGRNPVIASLSLGATRRFVLKRKAKNKHLKYELNLSSGSLLILDGELQHHWQHSIPKTKLFVEPRINLTFRKIINI